jgi:hypothetical protein
MKDLSRYQYEARHSHPSHTTPRASEDASLARLSPHNGQAQPSLKASHTLAGLVGDLSGAVQVSVSRSSVMFDGKNTHIEAEEQRYVGGEWSQQRVEGVWEGDHSQAAIQRLSRTASPFKGGLTSRRSTKRPLPRGK